MTQPTPNPNAGARLMPSNGLDAEMMRVEMARVLEGSLDVHFTQASRAAMRSGLGHAAMVCDLLAKQILQRHSGRGGKGPPTKLGRQLAAIAKRCGDEIWKYQEGVHVPRE